MKVFLIYSLVKTRIFFVILPKNNILYVRASIKNTVPVKIKDQNTSYYCATPKDKRKELKTPKISI